MPKKTRSVESDGHPAPADPVPAGGPAAGAPPEEAPAHHGGNGCGDGQKRPPAHVIRLGRVKVTVWVNYTREGKPFYATVPARVYRTADGDWAQTTSFDRSDLLVLAEALRLAFLWIAANPLANGDDDVPF